MCDSGQCVSIVPLPKSQNPVPNASGQSNPLEDLSLQGLQRDQWL